MPGRHGSLAHRLTKRSWVIAVVVGAVAIAAGASAWALTSGSGSNYRTASAAIGNVEETLAATGTLQTVNTAQLSFQVAGQVASVAVAVGQQVTGGQVLATLDSSSLTSAVDSDESTVTAAQDTLESAEVSETSTAASSSSTTSTTLPSGSGQPGANNSAIAADQAALTADQHKTDTDSAQAQADLTKATTICATSTSGGSSGSGSSTDGSASGSGSSTDGNSGSSGSSTGSLTLIQPSTTTTTTSPASCTNALEQVLTDQQTVSQDEQTVSAAETTLAKALGTSSVASDQSGAGSSGAGSSGTSPGTSPSSASSSVATPDQIAADQATLDADEAQLNEAQTSLDEGGLVSPIDGTVASVGMTAGQNVAADSSSDQIVVIGPQSFEVSTTVPVTDLPEIKTGDEVFVSPDGQSSQLTGDVTQIGPPPTSSSSTDYPVVISLPAGSKNLYDGASASVAIVVAQATNAVTVPTSAVHQLGQLAYVSELRNGKLQDATVTLGVVGNELTQVSSGIKAGETVILANLSESLPSSNSTSGPASFAGVGALEGTGGFGGGGFIERSGGATSGG